MSYDRKILPAEWEKIDGIRVMDPDGWDRKNFKESWNTPITRADWLRRKAMSTIYRDPSTGGRNGS